MLVYAGGLVEELEEAAVADETSGELVITDGPHAETKEWIGGLTTVDVAHDDAARLWVGKVAGLAAAGAPSQLRLRAGRGAWGTSAAERG